MADELQKHLESSRYGSPKINPDEQRHYLGTFRERCYLSMTVAEMKNEQDKRLLEQALGEHKDATVLINGKIPESLQATYIALLTKKQATFTIVNDTQTADLTSIGLLIAAEQAVNEAIIDIEQKYETSKSAEAVKEKKRSFWGKLF